MITDWPISPAVMYLSFPLLCGALMLLVYCTVQVMPRTIREHQVSYRPIRTHLADLRLIVRLYFSRREPAPAVVHLPSNGFRASRETGRKGVAAAGVL